MKAFELAQIAGPTILIGLCTFAVSLRVTRNAAWALYAATIKAGLFAVYFGWLFDGTFNFLDDLTYVDRGLQLLDQDVGLSNLASNWELVLLVGQGDHFIYYLYNTYAFRLFGEGYYAPVTCNILLTIAIAYFGAHLARDELSLPPAQRRLLYIFILLHPDILAWSTVLNGKETLILLIHVVLLQAVALYFRGQVWRALLLGALAGTLLTFLRFYVPFMFVMALALNAFVRMGKRRILLRIAASSALLAGAYYMLGAQVEQAREVAAQTFVNPAFGFMRMLLTPIPFNTEAAYAFLNIPALLHWLLLPALFAGFLVMWRLRSPFSGFFVIYALLFIGLYAFVGELQGPRHRVQLDYAIALLQFVGLLKFFSPRSHSAIDANLAPTKSGTAKSTPVAPG